MYRAVGSTLLLFLAMVPIDAVTAQQPGTEPKASSIGAEVVAVNACVREVRHGVSASRFEAYLGPQGQMRYVGTDEEIRRFKQCMQDKGYPDRAR